MYTNLMIDFGIGMGRVLGDFVGAWYKCNTRNNLLLENVLRERGRINPVLPPVEPKQSMMRRIFGPGPNAPGSHPGGENPSGAVGQDIVASNDAFANRGLPAKQPTQIKPAHRPAGREQDLEGQTDTHKRGFEDIHYSREG